MAECTQVREQAAELALGILPAEERAAALAHLDECRECRGYVRELTVVGEELLTLLPSVEPPPGFEQKVLDGVVAPARRTRKGRLIAAAVAATVWVAGWLVGAHLGWPAGSDDETAPHRDVVMEAKLTSTGQPVGQAFVYADRPAWTYMDVDHIDGRSGVVRCHLVLRDGRTVEIGTFRLAAGRGHWGGPIPAAAADLGAIRLVGADGAVLAAASFG
jgi:hypothetical protein